MYPGDPARTGALVLSDRGIEMWMGGGTLVERGDHQMPLVKVGM